MFKTFIESEKIASNTSSESWLLTDAAEVTVNLDRLYRLPEQALVVDDDLVNSPIKF